MGTVSKTKIVWREWYSDAAVAKMTEMRTLPRYETEIDARFMCGEDVAAEIAEDANKNDFEQFMTGGKLVVVEPEEFAGTYNIEVDYEPRFSAFSDDL